MLGGGNHPPPSFGHRRVKMQMHKLLFVLKLLDPLHNYFSKKNCTDGLCSLKTQQLILVKVSRFPIGGSKSIS